MDYLALLKHSLYIDGNFEDDYLNHLLEVSKSVIQDALDYVVLEDNIKFKQAVILLAGHYYDNRLETSEKTLANIPFGIASLIEQLRGETPYENLKVQ